MTIYHYTATELKPVNETSFGAEGIFERQDLQRLLRSQIDVLGERLFVIAEEFCDWVDSSRRIDLLCLDADANLVVVELKRTDDGGHMELQALRYAAMVSQMTFEQAVDAHARYRRQSEADSARSAILQFLGLAEVDAESFAQAVRVILVSADFGKELTTAVLWLRDHELDIRCVRIKPYRMADGPILLDVQQLIPLPETAEFQTRIGVKQQEQRGSLSARHLERLDFWEGLLAYARTRTDIHANRKPTKDMWISGGIGRTGFSLIYSVRRNDCQVELWISFGAGQSARNKAAFAALLAQEEEIHAAFGGPLDWQPLPDGDGCRVRLVMDGGYKTPVSERQPLFERLVDAMIRLDNAMRGRVAALQF